MKTECKAPSLETTASGGGDEYSRRLNVADQNDEFRHVIDTWLSRNWGAISEDNALPEMGRLKCEIQSLLCTHAHLRQ